MRKFFNCILNFALFALIGAFAGAVVGCAAGVTVAAIFAIGEGWFGAGLGSHGVSDEIFMFWMTLQMGAGLGMFAGGVAGFYSALFFMFFRRRFLAILFGAIAVFVVLKSLSFGSRDLAPYLIFIFSCVAGHVLGVILQRLWKSVKAQEERFAAEISKQHTD